MNILRLKIIAAIKLIKLMLHQPTIVTIMLTIMRLNISQLKNKNQNSELQQKELIYIFIYHYHIILIGLRWKIQKKMKENFKDGLLLL